MLRRSHLSWPIATLLLMVILSPGQRLLAATTTYPTKPIRLITTTAVGGITNEVARLAAMKLSERLGVPMVTDARAGAGGVIATEMAAKAQPDGHTLLFATGTHVTHAALGRKLPYDPIKSFEPIAKLGDAPFALVVHPSLPVKSVKELIAFAKQKPGFLFFSTSGAGGSAHLGAELLKSMAGIDFSVVHFKGGGLAMTSLLGSQVHGAIGALSQYLPHVKAGKLRLLATAGPKRSKILPDVPTIAEGAGLPGYEISIWWGMLAPAQTSPAIIARLDKELNAILASDEVNKWFLSQGAEVGYLGSVEFSHFIENQLDKWSTLVKKARIQAN